MPGSPLKGEPTGNVVALSNRCKPESVRAGHGIPTWLRFSDRLAVVQVVLVENKLREGIGLTVELPFPFGLNL